jgi:iron complex transport system substrate-binding protein
MRLSHGSQAVGLCALLVCAAAHAAPQRVVSADLCSDEYVYRLVPRDHIAALSWLAGDTHPVVSTIADKVRGIVLIHASTEEVLSRAPDLVVLYQGTNPRLRAQLAEAHVPILEIPPADSLAQVRAVTLKLGRVLGAPRPASAMLAAMDRTLKRARAAAPRSAVSALVYEPNGYATSGGLDDEIMTAAGLKDAAPGMNMTRSGTIPIEAVIAAAPSLLILNGGNGRVRSRAELMLRNPALAALSKTTSIVSVSLTPLLCPGPWSVDVAPALARLGRDALARNRAQP